MLLISLEIKNYRSLEDVKLEGLEKFNVLIGRNNSGKSAVIGALAYLNEAIHGRQLTWERALRWGIGERPLELYLTFKPLTNEREEFIDLLCALSPEVQSRRDRLLESSLLRQIEFSFQTVVANPQLLHLDKTKVLAEDGNWAIVQTLRGDKSGSNPLSHFRDFASTIRQNGSFEAGSIDLDITGGSIAEVSLSTVGLWQPSQPSGALQSRHDPNIWPQRQLAKYFHNAFFFTPFRHSQELMPTQQNDALAQDGSNLVQVLHTISSNNRLAFQKIEHFIETALPDVGMLHSKVAGVQTKIDFQSRDGAYYVPLHDMGGGVEQLLLVAIVLSTTTDESTIFLEEPESHLHPGAQRFLIDQLYGADRQIFLTTHSPIFVNLSRPASIYQTTYTNGRTTVTRLSGAELLGQMLQDIGARNSDVLLSDAVLFVEGPSDGEALSIWSETLKPGLRERNVTLLPMGGGEYSERRARTRSDVLIGISQGAPIPHMFVFDRDERSQAEIQKLQQTLGDRAHLLEKRELENYLLVPLALLAAIRSKCHDNTKILEQIDQTRKEEITRLISAMADSLYGLVLLKRIRVEIEGFKGGLLSREMIEKLLPHAQDPKLSKILREEIRSRMDDHLSKIDLDTIVREQTAALDSEWADPKRRLSLAPGEEILENVFEHFGAHYEKGDDTVRIAREMGADEIDSEIKSLIEQAINLTKLD